MLFLTCRGNATAPAILSMLKQQDMFGGFFTASKVNTRAVKIWDNWALDNGMFSNRPIREFLRCLQSYAPYRSTCKFVVVPDVPFDWESTLKRFRLWHKDIKMLGYPVAIAVQDGATVANVPWEHIDALFIGGSTEWKRAQWRIDGDMPLFTGIPVVAYQDTSVMDLIHYSKLMGKWVHMGRQANSVKQLEQAFAMGADSVDGTGEIYTPDKKFIWIEKTMHRLHKKVNQ